MSSLTYLQRIEALLTQGVWAQPLTNHRLTTKLHRHKRWKLIFKNLADLNGCTSLGGGRLCTLSPVKLLKYKQTYTITYWHDMSIMTTLSWKGDWGRIRSRVVTIYYQIFQCDPYSGEEAVNRNTFWVSPDIAFSNTSKAATINIFKGLKEIMFTESKKYGDNEWLNKQHSST